MGTIVTCACGARIRLPDAAEGKTLRCPRCKAELAPAVSARVLAASPARPGMPGVVCPICQSPVGADDAVVTCSECDQIHHRDCWTEVGGCSTYGCGQAPAPEKEAPPSRPLTAWGDTKTCPACGETIKSIALRCRYCGTDFPTVDPMQPGDLRRGVRKAEELRGLRTTVVGLFAVGLIGCLAPVILILSLVIILPRRQDLKKAGPFYLVLGYSTIALSVVYSILMFFFFLAEMK